MYDWVHRWKYRFGEFEKEILEPVRRIRAGYNTMYPEGRTNIDLHVPAWTFGQIFQYLPRMTQVAFFAPFPTHWVGQGSEETTTVMRRISAVEMLGVYLALCFLPVVFWRWSRRVELWLAAMFCLALMYANTLFVPNVGALYRFRYGYLMVFVALGLAGLVVARDWLRLRRLASQPSSVLAQSCEEVSV